MLNTPLIADLIFKGEVSEIKEIMKKSRNLGMQTFDQALSPTRTTSFPTRTRCATPTRSTTCACRSRLNSQRGRTQDLSAGTENFAIV